MQKCKVYQIIAARLQAIANCEQTGNTEWRDKHQAVIDYLVDGYLPSGSGFDSGTKLSGDSTPNKLVFDTAYHHMSEHGYYDGWTHHTVIVWPDLANGFTLKVGGRDRNDIKDYIHDTFYTGLVAEISDDEIAKVQEKA